MVGDRELYSAATELTRIMEYKNPGRFFNDPTAAAPNAAAGFQIAGAASACGPAGTRLPF
jgi:hypothetical protein